MPDEVLTTFQRAVLEVFFSLPESSGYVLAGGAGLVAVGLSTRPTQDLDVFGADLQVGVGPAADALEAACRSNRWTTERIRDHQTFRRLVVHAGDDELLVDVAVDSPPLNPPTITALGPTYAPEELAARKVLALVDRAEARDFVDVASLSEHFDLDHLATLAGELDGGFTTGLLADALATHRRFDDSELTDLGGNPSGVRDLAERWRSQLLDRSE